MRFDIKKVIYWKTKIIQRSVSKNASKIIVYLIDFQNIQIKKVSIGVMKFVSIHNCSDNFLLCYEEFIGI